MATPSYSFWATRMVWLALKRSLREASCCSVDVVNGGCGRRFTVLRSIEATLNARPSMRATAAFAAVSSAMP